MGHLWDAHESPSARKRRLHRTANNVMNLMPDDDAEFLEVAQRCWQLAAEAGYPLPLKLNPFDSEQSEDGPSGPESGNVTRLRRGSIVVMAVAAFALTLQLSNPMSYMLIHSAPRATVYPV